MHEKLDPQFIGTSLSHGTLRREDLIPEFLFFLEEHDPDAAAKLTTTYSGEGWPYSQCGLTFGDPFNETQEELAQDLLEDLFNALDRIAPEGTYFGSHPGDGSDFGFWIPEDGFVAVWDEED